MERPPHSVPVAVVRILSFSVLFGLYALAVAASFLSPYSHKEQFREFFYAPPTAVHFRDAQGQWHLRPFIYGYEVHEDLPRYRETERRIPLYFLVEGSPYEWMGITLQTHLFGLREPGKNVFLLGSDSLGRDLFSRILHGARFSLTIGVVGILFASLLGVFLGALGGYFSGWVDTLVMRCADLFLSLPSLFLILGIRAVFPLQMDSSNLFWVMILAFALVGWASIARVIRGQVLSLKTQQHVLAARASGASHWRILTRHILPFTANYLMVQSTVLIPAFIMGEITLSFLGVGVQEPSASWGSLLQDAASLRVFSQSPWLLAPVAFIFATVLASNLAGGDLRRGKTGPESRLHQY